MVHRLQGRQLQHFHSQARDRSDRGHAHIVRKNRRPSIPLSILNSVYSGKWKTSTFKKYNFEAEGIPTNGGALHPLLKVREEMRNIFLEMG